MKSLLDDVISMPVKSLTFNSVGNFEVDAMENDERFQKLVTVRNSIQNIEEDGFELHSLSGRKIKVALTEGLSAIWKPMNSTGYWVHSLYGTPTGEKSIRQVANEVDNLLQRLTRLKS